MGYIAGRDIMARMLAALLMIVPAAARWCQIENVKADIHGNYSYAGPWRVDGCTTLSLDHGYCAESDCPWRVKLTDEAIIELADKLHGNSALTALSIAANKISDEGCMAIAEALRDNEVLTDLNLSGNQIGDQGGLALADVLKTNSVLTNVNLEYNRISDESARVLVDQLKSAESALDALNLGNNKVSPDILAECEDANQLAYKPPARGTPALSGKDEM